MFHIETKVNTNEHFYTLKIWHFYNWHIRKLTHKDHVQMLFIRHSIDQLKLGNPTDLMFYAA